MKAFFYVIDPTVEKRQGNDVGDQYQTGIYFADEASQKTVEDYTAKEREKHDVFAVEVAPLSSFFPAEEYHQDYLDKNPNGYCHIPVQAFRDINGIISEKEDAAAQSRWEKPSRDILRENLSDLQYEVTQNGATNTGTLMKRASMSISPRGSRSFPRWTNFKAAADGPVFPHRLTKTASRFTRIYLTA